MDEWVSRIGRDVLLRTVVSLGSVHLGHALLDPDLDLHRHRPELRRAHLSRIVGTCLVERDD